MRFDPTPAWHTKHRWSLCRSGNLNQQLEPEFLNEFGSRKPDRSQFLLNPSHEFITVFKITLISHQLDFSGAPLALLEMSKVFVDLNFSVNLVFLLDGPLRSEFEGLGVQCGKPDLPIAKPDLVVANTVLSIPLSNRIRRHGIRVVNWIHESKWFLDALKINENNIDFDQVTEILIPSQFLVDELKPYFKNAIFAVLPNFIDTSIDEVVQRTGHVVVPGSWEQRKGQGQLLELMRKANVDLPLVFLGATTNNTNLGRHYRFTGQVMHNDALKIIGTSSLLISPAISETQNLSALEAIAQRVPLMLSNISAHRELASYFGAIPLFNMNEPESFIAALRQAAQDSTDLQKLEARRGLLVDRFGPKAYRARLLYLCKNWDEFGKDRSTEVREIRPNPTTTILVTIVTVVLAPDSELEITRESILPILKEHNDIEWLIKADNWTGNQAETFKTQDRVRFVILNDSSIYQAMNQATSAASGEYLLFIGSGDTLIAEGIRNMLNKLRHRSKKHPLICFSTYMDDWGRNWNPEPEGIKSRMSLPHAGVLINKACIENSGGFDERYRIAGDYDLISKIILRMTGGLVWRDMEVIAKCSGGGVSARHFFEAFLEELLVRIRVWSLTYASLAEGVQSYLRGPFSLLMRRFGDPNE